VLYESPFRVAKLLEDIASIDPERHVCIGRELTKIHEEIVIGTPQELAQLFPPQSAKGEFCILVEGNESL